MGDELVIKCMDCNREAPVNDWGFFVSSKPITQWECLGGKCQSYETICGIQCECGARGEIVLTAVVQDETPFEMSCPICGRIDPFENFNFHYSPCSFGITCTCLNSFDRVWRDPSWQTPQFIRVAERLCGFRPVEVADWIGSVLLRVKLDGDWLVIGATSKDKRSHDTKQVMDLVCGYRSEDRKQEPRQESKDAGEIVEEPLERKRGQRSLF